MPQHREDESADEVAARYGLEPLPFEGGRFRRTWAGPPDGTGRPAGSAILFLLSPDEDGFSAPHRLPADEVWHFYRGDPAELLLLAPDGRSRTLLLGDEADRRVQWAVPAGTWMAARVAPGGRWSLCGTTMAPGFVPADFEAGDPGMLAARYPAHAALIRALSRPAGAAGRAAADSTHREQE
ncbi:cupin domain-containing protein [Streptomyces sp. MI02-7b]|uniref:cupin domain-containing protein n=1 Tax=Streptomyces sp. MI02-7b TaxID=462941 RepID=UPI0029AA7D34|nr:cupin domain-containing protein [Streptomyces sp. MI02-7b]MDX3076840.1 cupin domain-containing protein [Streptomyces sp. MI02-7b]